MKSETVITDKERVRRLLALPGVKPERVNRLRDARVAVVGMGGLGNPASQYLVAQGVGHLTLIDPDVVAAHNLSRQLLFSLGDVGRLKVEAARDALIRIAPSCHIDLYPEALNENNAASVLAGADVVVDGLDQGAPREILNRYSVHTKVPVFFGGGIGYEAQVFGVQGGRPCLYCLFGSVALVAEECAVAGVLGPVVGMAGLVQAQEVLKWLLGVGEPLLGRLWTFDAYSGRTRILTIPARPDCPVCGHGEGVAHEV